MQDCDSRLQKHGHFGATLPSLQTVPRRGPHRHMAPVVLKQFIDAKRRCGNQISFPLL